MLSLQDSGCRLSGPGPGGEGRDSPVAGVLQAELGKGTGVHTSVSRLFVDSIFSLLPLNFLLCLLSPGPVCLFTSPRGFAFGLFADTAVASLDGAWAAI